MHIFMLQQKCSCCKERFVKWNQVPLCDMKSTLMLTLFVTCCLLEIFASTLNPKTADDVEQTVQTPAEDRTFLLSALFTAFTAFKKYLSGMVTVVGKWDCTGTVVPAFCMFDWLPVTWSRHVTFFWLHFNFYYYL